MDDKANIGLINSHSKSNGCDNHLDFIPGPSCLDDVPITGSQASVIKCCVDLEFGLQIGSHDFTVLLRDAINNSRFPRVSSRDETDNVQEDVLGLGNQLITQIRSIEAL